MILGDVLLGFFAGALGSVLAPLFLEVILGGGVSSATTTLLGALGAALGGFVAGMLSHGAEWLRGAGVGILLLAYHQWRATLPESGDSVGTLAILALPAAVLGALVSTWGGAGRLAWWEGFREKTGTVVVTLRILGAVVAGAMLLAPATGPQVMALGFAGVLLFLLAGYLRGPLQTVAIFMEDKCRTRRGARR
jgi:hypothetical protein